MSSNGNPYDCIAWAAVVFSASRLILLKSVDIPPGTSWYDAAERGWVDRHFPIIAYRLAASRLTGMVPVEVVNFRRWLDDSFPPHD